MIKVTFESTFEDNKKLESSREFACESTDLMKYMKQLEVEISKFKEFKFKHFPRLIRLDVIKIEIV